MHNSQKLSVIFSATSALTIITYVAAPVAFAQMAIGVVDRDKVVTSYPKAQQAADELKKSEDHVHKMIEDSNKSFEDAKASHKPQAELNSLQKKLQESIDSEVKNVQGKAQNLENQLEADIDTAIKAEASSRKMDAVLVKQAVLLGGTDITDGVVKRLTSSTSTAKSATK